MPRPTIETRYIRAADEDDDRRERQLTFRVVPFFSNPRHTQLVRENKQGVGWQTAIGMSPRWFPRPTKKLLYPDAPREGPYQSPPWEWGSLDPEQGFFEALLQPGMGTERKWRIVCQGLGTYALAREFKDEATARRMWDSLRDQTTIRTLIRLGFTTLS